MPAQWVRVIDRPDAVHYADLALAGAWIDYAMSLTSVDNENALNGRDSGGQIAAVTAAYKALGSAYKALDVDPTTDPTYLAVMRQAYGGIWSPPQDAVSIRGDNAGSEASTARSMWNVRPQGILDSPSVPDNAVLFVRAQINKTGDLLSSCMRQADCTRTYTAIRRNGDRCEASPDDWQCGGYDGGSVFGGVPIVLTPLVDTFVIARSLATKLKQQGALAAVTAAVDAGSRTITGTGAAPTQTVGDPPGWTRPAPTTPHLGGGPISINPSNLGGVTLNRAPVVTLNGLVDGTQANTPYTLSLTATPQGYGATIQRVELYVNGQLAGTSTAAPWAFPSVSLGPGAYVVSAMAYDSQNRSGTSASYHLTVLQPQQAAPPAAQACALPQVTGGTDPYFLSSSDRDAWIAANPSCPLPPPYRSAIAPTTQPQVPAAPSATTNALWFLGAVVVVGVGGYLIYSYMNSQKTGA